MSTTIAIRFPWGRYHSTPWGRNANEGAVDWPPSTWRLLRSLYSVWKTRAPELDEVLVHEVLAGLAGAPGYVVPPFSVAHTRHYMPDRSGGTDKAFDTWVTVPQDADVLLCWPVDLDSSHREVLTELLDLLPYLGRAESVCEARLLSSDEVPDSVVLLPATVDDPRERVRVLLPALPLDVEKLTARTTAVRAQKRLDPPGSTWVDYPKPDPVQSDSRRGTRKAEVSALRWRIATGALPARTAALSMTTALRGGVLKTLTDAFGDGSSPPNVHGKGDDGLPLVGHGHAHFLAYTSDPDTTGPSRLDTLVMWIPGKVDEDELAPLRNFSELRARSHPRDFRDCRLGLEGVGSLESVAPELVGWAGDLGGSRTWETYTPFAPPRHGRKNRAWWDHVEKDVHRELQVRGFPAPSSVVPLAEHQAALKPPGGWLDFRRNRPDRERLRDARRATGVRLVFDEPVSGPIAIGALSHFGLGLFLPTSR